MTPFLFRVLKDNVGELDKIVSEDPIIAKRTLQMTTSAYRLQVAGNFHDKQVCCDD